MVMFHYYVSSLPEGSFFKEEPTTFHDDAFFLKSDLASTLIFKKTLVIYVQLGNQ